MADTDSQVYGQTRYHPEYDGRQGGYSTAYSIYDSLPYASRIVHSIDQFTTGSGSRRQSVGGRSTIRAGAAINNAFSFLNTEDYNAYKYYSDIDEPVSLHTDLSNGYTNGYTNGHGPYSYPKSGDSPNSKDQLKIIKIAIVILLISLCIVIAVGTAMYFVFRNNNSSEAPVKQEIYRFKAMVQFNTTHTNAHYDNTSAEYLDFTKMLRDGIDQVFASGAFSSIYNSTEMLTLSRSTNGFITAQLYIVFKDPEEKFVKSSLVELVQGEVKEELATHVTETIVTIIITDPDVPVVTTPAGVPDPTTPAGTGFTTAAPITLPTAEDLTSTSPTTDVWTSVTETSVSVRRPTPSPVDCVTLTEPLCTSYYSRTGPISSSASDNFKNLHKAQSWNCYQHTTAFVCSAIYPECSSRKLIKPCRIFCESFKAACNVPIKCESFPDDDLGSTCVLAPGYVAPQPPSPPTNPCTGQFRCGTDPPTCVALTKKCDGTTDCADGSDETSTRADCDNVLDSSLQCEFAAGTTCQYTQFTDDDFDWLVVKPPTASADTGPHYDHTSLGTTGYVLHAEASGQQWGEKARLASPLVIVPEIQCLHFYYHMTGANVGSLKVLLVLSSGRENVQWFRSGDQTNLWKKSQLSLPIGTTRIIFETERGSGFKGDIGIDDISVTSGECTNTGCEEGEFECTNTNCQPLTVVCNGKTECGDFSDEMDCTCTASQFRCAMGMCVKDYEKCDGTSQCPDDSDEINCSEPCSSDAQHKCNNNNCIQPEWLCDGNNDCGDNSDETNCPSCANGMFKCADSSCIDGSKRCDGVNDCPTHTDEQNCYNKEADNTLMITKGTVDDVLCAENLPGTPSVNGELCRQIGLGSFVSRSTITKASTKYYKWKTGSPWDGSQSLLTAFETSDTCSGNNVLTITCMQKACGLSTIATNQIVNGKDALAGRWPWMAALFRKGTDGGSSFICGATIITMQHVITAAHCISGLQNSPELFEVLVGSIDNTNRASPAQLRQVLVVKIPSEFSVYYRGSDLAILELDRKLVLGSYVQPVCLPDSQEVFGPASIFYSTGWGKTETGMTSSVLKGAKLKHLDFATCNAKYTFDLNTKSVCAGYASGFIANCQGDSGGPLMSRGPDDRWRLIGTYSFGQTQTDGTCQTPEKPSVFTKIQDFLTWIESQTQCVFDCGNGECLYNAALKCDGVIDCSNRQDETTAAQCNPTIDCDFSDPYRCGFTALDIGGFELRQGMATITGNRGPITGHTQGTSTDNYLYGKGPMSGVMSPVYNKNSAHCLGFYSQRRGETSARLRIYVTQTFDINAPWTVDISSIPANDLKYDEMGSEYAGWLRHLVDIPAGQYLIVFVTSTTGETETGIGIDDVTLTPGACSAVVCPADHVACVAPNIPHSTCIPYTPGRCNYVEDCPLSATDEQSCTPADQQNYVCTLDKYEDCSIRQHHGNSEVPDNHDFRLTVANPSTINQPPTDANTQTGGYMLVMDTRLQANGELAIISIVLGNRNSIGCFKFKYWVESEGSLRVHIDQFAEPWSVARTVSTDWNTVEIAIQAHEYTISLTGAIGASPATRSFIAVDDFSFTKGNCLNPSCSDGKITCNNGQCIDQIQFCNGHSDCPDGDDEPDGCDCMPGFFQCKYTRGCIPITGVCNGAVECPDLSDELNCTCGTNTFKCDIGICIDSNLRCNDNFDCRYSSSDEKGCTCAAGSFPCSEGGCFPDTLRCNGIEDCSDGSDERNCAGCKSYEYQCADQSKCVPNDAKCDGWVDCDDNSDEANCVCEANSQFYCNSTGATCMPASTRCNSVTECETEVDEGGCGSDTERCAGNPANCDCGSVGQATNQIAGGSISDPNTWSWACALYRDGGFLCGCVVINERWVTTAAHCFFSENGIPISHVSDYRLRVDTTKSLITDGGTVYRMEKYLLHTSYSFGLLVEGDIAMVKLTTAVAFSSSVKPVCMPEPAQEFTQNSHCFVIGWGYTGSSTNTPRDLREARIRVLPTAQCASSWPTVGLNIGFDINTNLQLCAIYETALIQTCGGDSGSPMICKDASTNRWQLAGVTSGGHSMCGRTTQQPQFPSIFTKMSAYVSWIDGVINAN